MPITLFNIVLLNTWVASFLTFMPTVKPVTVLPEIWLLLVDFELLLPPSIPVVLKLEGVEVIMLFIIFVPWVYEYPILFSVLLLSIITLKPIWTVIPPAALPRSVLFLIKRLSAFSR